MQQRQGVAPGRGTAGNVVGINMALMALMALMESGVFTASQFRRGVRSRAVASARNLVDGGGRWLVLLRLIRGKTSSLNVRRVFCGEYDGRMLSRRFVLNKSHAQQPQAGLVEHL